MRQFSYLIGVMAAIGRLPNWERYFDLSRRGLKYSFFSQIVILPGFYFTAKISSEGRAEMLGVTAPSIQLAPVLIIGLVYLLSFSAVAYILAMVFDKQDRFRAWTIVRHWCVVFLAGFVLLGFVLFKINLIPLPAAYGVAFAAYIGLLFIDIRLAQRISGFDWGAATLAACLITVTGLSLLLTGVSQFG